MADEIPSTGGQQEAPAPVEGVVAPPSTVEAEPTTSPAEPVDLSATSEGNKPVDFNTLGDKVEAGLTGASTDAPAGDVVAATPAPDESALTEPKFDQKYYQPAAEAVASLDKGDDAEAGGAKLNDAFPPEDIAFMRQTLEGKSDATAAQPEAAPPAGEHVDPAPAALKTGQGQVDTEKTESGIAHEGHNVLNLAGLAKDRNIDPNLVLSNPGVAEALGREILAEGIVAHREAEVAAINEQLRITNQNLTKAQKNLEVARNSLDTAIINAESSTLVSDKNQTPPEAISPSESQG